MQEEEEPVVEEVGRLAITVKTGRKKTLLISLCRYTRATNAKLALLYEVGAFRRSRILFSCFSPFFFFFLRPLLLIAILSVNDFVELLAPGDEPSYVGESSARATPLCSLPIAIPKALFSKSTAWRERSSYRWTSLGSIWPTRPVGMRT